MAREQADVTPRSLTSIVWAMGKLRLFDAKLRAEMATIGLDSMFSVKKSQIKLLRQVIKVEVPELRRMAARRAAKRAARR